LYLSYLNLLLKAALVTGSGLAATAVRNTPAAAAAILTVQEHNHHLVWYCTCLLQV
jgi:hypothetical protein